MLHGAARRRTQPSTSLSVLFLHSLSLSLRPFCIFMHPSSPARSALLPASLNSLLFPHTHRRLFACACSSRLHTGSAACVECSTSFTLPHTKRELRFEPTHVRRMQSSVPKACAEQRGGAQRARCMLSIQRKVRPSVRCVFPPALQRSRCDSSCSKV